MQAAPLAGGEDASLADGTHALVLRQPRVYAYCVVRWEHANNLYNTFQLETD